MLAYEEGFFGDFAKAIGEKKGATSAPPTPTERTNGQKPRFYFSFLKFLPDANKSHRLGLEYG
jgi:hypothetical protein